MRARRAPASRPGSGAGAGAGGPRTGAVAERALLRRGTEVAGAPRSLDNAPHGVRGGARQGTT